MRNLRDIFVLEDSENPSMNLEIAMESAMDGNPGSMRDHVVELFYNELSDLRNDSNNHNAFRFTAIPKIKGLNSFVDNPVVKDILNDSLTLSNPNKFNDPMDPIVREWINIQKKNSHETRKRSLFRMMNKVLTSNLRMACLSTPVIDRDGESKVTDCSLLMWAHYAAMHRGICIEYAITEDTLRQYNDGRQLLKWCNVRYRDTKAMCSDITLDNALLAKSAVWSYEKESRLIYFSKDSRDSDYITLSGFPVKAVYLGYRVSKKTKAQLKELLARKDIPLYKIIAVR